MSPSRPKPSARVWICRAHPGERPEAHRIVWPFVAVGCEIRIAGPIEQVRRVDHQQSLIFALSAQKTRGPAKKILDAQNLIGRSWERKQRRISGDKCPAGNAQSSECLRQRGCHICKTAGLDIGIEFGNDRKDLNYIASLSIIGWVIRHTPFSVLRNRLASS